MHRQERKHNASQSLREFVQLVHALAAHKQNTNAQTHTEANFHQRQQSHNCEIILTLTCDFEQFDYQLFNIFINYTPNQLTILNYQNHHSTH